MSKKSSNTKTDSSSLITWTSNKPIFQTLTTRAWILTCFYVTVILSLPFWIQTTTIERLPLPREEVQQWEAQLPCPIRFRHTLTLRLPIGIVASENEAEVTKDLARALEAAGDGVWKSERRRVGKDSDNTAAAMGEKDDFESIIPLEHAACIDWNVRLNEIGKLEPSSLHYVITIAQDDATESFLSTSTTRHFTLNSIHPLQGKAPAEIVWSLASQLSRHLQLPYRDLFFRESFPTIGQESNGALTTDNILQSIGMIEMDKRQIPFTRNVRLVFSLINEDVSAVAEDRNSKRQTLSGVAGWNETESTKAFVRRIGSLVEALHGTHKIMTEMQTIWYAPLQFTPNVLEIPRIVSNIKSERSKYAKRKRKEESKRNESAQEGELETEESEDDDIVSVLDEASNVPQIVEKDKIYLIRQDDLQIFVNAGEWGLSSSSSGNEMLDAKENVENQPKRSLEDDLAELVRQQERTLHFVIYIPKPNHRPLRIAADDQLVNVSAATGWLVPQWGGVSLYNLGYENHEQSGATRITNNDEEIHNGGRMLNALTSEDLDKAFTSFDKQLRSLLGLRKPNGISEEDSAFALPSSDARLALALDALVRRRTLGSMRESVRTLASIIRLVEKIKILGVGIEVQNDIKEALNMLKVAKELRDDNSAPILRQGSSSPIPAPLSPLRSLLDLHYNAELLSSRAFFNPSMLGQLYFPDEHKYAVYTPLFGPLAMPLLVAAIRLIKERRLAKSKKKEAEKINANKILTKKD